MCRSNAVNHLTLPCALSDGAIINESTKGGLTPFWEHFAVVHRTSMDSKRYKRRYLTALCLKLHKRSFQGKRKLTNDFGFIQYKEVQDRKVKAATDHDKKFQIKLAASFSVNTTYHKHKTFVRVRRMSMSINEVYLPHRARSLKYGLKHSSATSP